MKTRQAGGASFPFLTAMVLRGPCRVGSRRSSRLGGLRYVLLPFLLLTLSWTGHGQTADEFNPGANGTVWGLAVQPDGKVLATGSFTTLGGQARNGFGRLNADGTLDTTFNPGVRASTLAVQPDGRILVGGYFSEISGTGRSNIGRLNADGTVDLTFNPGANSPVNCLAVQPDGKIVVGGYFSVLGGLPRSGVGRLNPDGTVDPTFQPSTVVSAVYCLAVQPDGKVLVGASFTLSGKPTQADLVRLNADGTLDTGFASTGGANCSCLAVQPDGKILVGGDFSTLCGQPRSRIARLNADGTLDTSFNPIVSGSGVYPSVSTLALQTDGKILVGGTFDNVSGSPCMRLARLNLDGTVDTSFLPGAGSPYVAWVRSLAMQADGRLLVGGEFTILAGQMRADIGRLNSQQPVTAALSCDGSTVRWTRSGPGPEVWSTAFFACTNGRDWFDLGAGTRSAEGWRVSGAGLPANATLRACGFVTGGFNSASSWLVETMSGPAVITSQPASRTNQAGTMASFKVGVAGTTPATCQWLKDGAPLSESANILGAGTPTLTLSNVWGGDAGGYSVIISNGFGAVTSAVATLTVIDPVLAAQPVSQAVNAGESVLLSVTVVGTAPLQYQWRKDGSAVAGATGATLAFTKVQMADAGVYEVTATNAFGRVTSTQAVLWVNGALADSLNPEADGAAYAMLEQPDGKVVLGGEFTRLAGQARNHLGRLNADGTLDAGFTAGAGGLVRSLVLQEDGRLLVGGAFTNLAGQSRTNLGRLNPDGTLDASFRPSIAGRVYALLAQADGKVLVGGSFTNLNGQTRANLGRLNPDGSLDASFNAGTASPYYQGGSVYSLALQPDGRILVGGNFTWLNGQGHTNLGRLNPDGSVDTTFNASAGNPSVDNVQSLAVQADGKLLVGGGFSLLNGQTCKGLGRLDPDGKLDTTFNAGLSNSSYSYVAVYSLLIQADGKILVGGDFSHLGRQACRGLGRLDAAGALDASFNPVTNGTVFALALQRDGRVLVSGSFTSLGGQPRRSIARVSNTGPATQSLGFDGTNITWLRGGTGPEVWRTQFDISTNGTDWTGVGTGSRVANGWQLAGASLPLNVTHVTLRARGFDWSGYGNGSASWVEAMIGPPAVSLQPLSRTNNAATGTTLSVTAGGTEPLSYQWRKNGVDLADGGNLSGATTPTLSFSSAWGADGGEYSVVISNEFGTVSSMPARLAVVDPILTNQPVSRTLEVGGSAQFSVAPVGTAPLFYQWRQDGVELAGATAATLLLTNVQGAQAGAYDVVVSNAFGTATSARALLTVNQATVDALKAGANGSVYTAAVQPDGRILVGGSFNRLGGQQRYGLGRLNPDGSLDTTFDVGGTDGYGRAVRALAVQPDGKILVGGEFITLCDQACTNLGRLNADGTFDRSFNLPADGGINALIVQPDGQVVVGGNFTMLGDQPRPRVGRLNADGSLDPSFRPTVDGSVNSLAVQGDGKVLLNGWFYMGDGHSRPLLRLNLDGSLDNTFNPSPISPSDGGLAVQPDGKILISANAARGSRVVRLNPDGSLDEAFRAGPTDNACSSISALALQADGKILFYASHFAAVGGQPRTNIARLNGDGSLDPTFNPGAAGGSVYSLTVQPDGKLLLCGSGSIIMGGQARTNLGRLNNTGPATETLSFDGATITWLRGGTSPEACQTSFEVSTNGLDWSRLGLGTRIPGGWQLTAVSVPVDATFRARAFVAGGSAYNSSWFVETITGAQAGGAPKLCAQPASLSREFGTLATFSVVAGGTAPLSYQWRKDGIDLQEAGHVSGAGTPRLTLSSLSGADAGGYSVVVSNEYGSVTSRVASLSVTDPIITGPPVSQAADAGQTVTFRVETRGTEPMSYRWLKNAAELEENGNRFGAHSDALTLSNVLGGDAGAYAVVVSNACGSVTSRVAHLSVAEPLITGQPASHYAALDEAITLSVAAAGTAPIHYQWRKDGSSLAGASSASLVFAHARRADAGAYDVIVSTAFGAATSAVAVVSVSAADSLNPGVNGTVSAVALQTDGQSVLGGQFTRLGGEAHTCLGRLNADGTVDANFTAAADGWVHSLAIQNDGKLLVGGVFSTLCGQAQSYLGRLHPDGTLDTGFRPAPNSYVSCFAVQADGNILVGGSFTSLAGEPHQCLGRLHPDGTPDWTFAASADYSVYGLAVQADGKIVVVGAFTTLNGEPRNHLGRLNPDGTLDRSFNPDADSDVFCVALDGTGKILVAGDFRTLGGELRHGLGRLNSDGSVDLGFAPQTDSRIYSLAVQTDGRLLVGGAFRLLGGEPCNYFGRLEPGGGLDKTFDAETDASVVTIGLQANGRILAAGDFTTLGGQPRSGLGRLDNTGPASAQLTLEGSRVLWLRSGSGPEVWRVSFEASRKDTNWTSLGAGVRTADGWELSGVHVPAGTRIRARGFVAGGYLNGSGWLVEQAMEVVRGKAPLVVRANGAGTVGPNYNGRLLELGKTYCLTARPKAGHVFRNWTGDYTHDAPALVFVMKSNLVLQANFIPNPFPQVGGVYRGVVRGVGKSAPQGSGRFTIAVTRMGGFAGILRIGGKPYLISGRFNGMGKAQKQIGRYHQKWLSVSLQLDLSGEKGGLSGTVSDGTWTAEMAGEK